MSCKLDLIFCCPHLVCVCIGLTPIGMPILSQRAAASGGVKRPAAAPVSLSLPEAAPFTTDELSFFKTLRNYRNVCFFLHECLVIAAYFSMASTAACLLNSTTFCHVWSRFNIILSATSKLTTLNCNMSQHLAMVALGSCDLAFCLA